MRFLKSFLEEYGCENTTPRQVPEVPKPSSVSFGTSFTLVYGGEQLNPNEPRGEIEKRSKIVTLPRRCEHCTNSKELEGAPAWRRHGKIVERVFESDGRRELYCSFCGRVYDGLVLR